MVVRWRRKEVVVADGGNVLLAGSVGIYGSISLGNVKEIKIRVLVNFV